MTWIWILLFSCLTVFAARLAFQLWKTRKDSSKVDLWPPLISALTVGLPMGCAVLLVRWIIHIPKEEIRNSRLWLIVGGVIVVVVGNRFGEWRDSQNNQMSDGYKRLMVFVPIVTGAAAGPFSWLFAPSKDDEGIYFAAGAFSGWAIAYLFLLGLAWVLNGYRSSSTTNSPSSQANKPHEL